MTSKSTDFFQGYLFWNLRPISDKTVKFQPVTLKRSPNIKANDITKQSIIESNWDRMEGITDNLL